MSLWIYEFWNLGIRLHLLGLMYRIKILLTLRCCVCRLVGSGWDVEVGIMNIHWRILEI